MVNGSLNISFATNKNGEYASMEFPNPKEDLTLAEVKTVADKIAATEGFACGSHKLVSFRSATVRDVKVSEIAD